MKTKSCKRCKNNLELDCFSKAVNNKDGYSNTCKPCVVIRNREYWRTPYGRISFVHNVQRSSSKVRGHEPPAYTSKELHQWALLNGLTELWERWRDAAWCKELAPSVDRLDVLKGYTFNNLRLVTWQENNDAQYNDRKSCKVVTRQNRTVRQLSLSGELVAVHKSIASAARETGSVRTNINCMCSGNNPHIKSVNGFLWEYGD